MRRSPPRGARFTPWPRPSEERRSAPPPTMAGPMESPRTTFALGPLEVSFRRREDNVRLGVLGSLAVHVLVISVLIVAVPRKKADAEAEIAPTAKSAIPITFVDPLPRQPKPRQDEIVSNKPPPSTRPKPLR